MEYMKDIYHVLPEVAQGLERHIRIPPPTSIFDWVALVIVGIVSAGWMSRGILWDKRDPFYYTLFERPQLQIDGSKSAKLDSQPKAERNIAKHLEIARKTVVVFWGSQSGTAERLATRLAKECQLRFGLGTVCADLSDYDPESISDLTVDHLAIFVMSTYGEGDPSDNSTGFWNYIQSESQPKLPNLRYAAFGCGNSNYKYYNRVIDETVRVLSASGANLLLPLGKGDDCEGSTEEDFLAWRDNLFSFFRTKLHLEEKIEEFQPSINIAQSSSLKPVDLYQGVPVPLDRSDASSPIHALNIKSTRELFNSPERHCVHMELDLSEFSKMQYKTGDHVAVWPANPRNEVDILLKGLNLETQQDAPLVLDPANIDDNKLQIPSPTTYRALFEWYLEVGAPVSRDIIHGLSSFAPTSEAKDFLLRLSRDRSDYSRYCTHTQLTFGRLLQLASPVEPWAQLPIAYVIEALPLLRPRYYSISSSSVISPKRASITVLIAADSLPQNEQAKVFGVASNYLLALSNERHSKDTPSTSSSVSQSSNLVSPLVMDYHPTYNLAGPSSLLDGKRLFASIRRSRFKLPMQATCPIIMVAAGTGLAPFRAFIAERAKLHAIGKPIGQMILFFGCRYYDDFIYREELQEIHDSLGGDQVFKIITAFSRTTEHDDRQVKSYVQHRVKENADEVMHLLDNEGAMFYICGRAAMAREVSKNLTNFLIESKGWTDDAVQMWTNSLRRRGKWKEDVWG